MVARIIVTEISPQVETWLGDSWPRILAVGLGLLLAGVVILALPRLIAALLAIVFFVAASLVLVTAYHLWQLQRTNRASQVEID